VEHRYDTRTAWYTCKKLKTYPQKGTPPPANLARITVLQCGRPELLHAIAKSKLFRGAIHGWMGSGALLVKTDQVEKLRELLDWAGVTVGATFQVPDL
jgi:hypothetical protein